MAKYTKSEWWERAEQAFGETVQMRSERAVYVALGEARRQEATVKRVLRIFCDEPGALIADDVGMGKTYEALALASLALAHGVHKRVYVLAPGKPVRWKWEQDLEQFTQGNVRDDDVRDYLRRALKAIKEAAADDDAGEEDGEVAAAPSLSRTAYMRRLVEESRDEGITFLHRSMLVGRLTAQERAYFAYVAFRRVGRNKTTYKPWMRRHHLLTTFEPPAWLDREPEIPKGGVAEAEPIERAIQEQNVARLVRLGRSVLLRAVLPEADLLIIDEAHGLTRQYGAIVQHALRPSSTKVLLLSATPFQTDPGQIEDLCAVVWPEGVPPEMEAPGKALRAFVQARDALRARWNELSDDQLAAARTACEGATAPTFGAVARVREAMETARKQRKAVSSILGRFVVRSVRRDKADYRLLELGDPAAPVTGRPDRDDLIDRRGPGIPAGGDDLLVMATERLLRELPRGHDATFISVVRQNATSSYAALSDWITRGLKADEHGTVRFADAPRGSLDADPGFYAKLVRGLIADRTTSGAAAREHPKVEAVARVAARHAVTGEKSLIFCARLQTVRAIARAANAALHDLLHEQHGGGLPRREFDRALLRLREDFRYARGRLGVLLRENPIRTAMPRLLGTPCLPLELRSADDALVDRIFRALQGGPLDADRVIHACGRVMLERLEHGYWGHRTRSRRNSLSESDAAVLEQLRSRPDEGHGAAPSPGARGGTSRATVKRVCEHLLRGPDFFAPFAGLLSALGPAERSLATAAVRQAFTTPVMLAPLIGAYGEDGGGTLERMGSELQVSALAFGDAVERLLSPGVGNLRDRLEAAAEHAGDAIVSLESSEDTERKRHMLFNAPFYPLAVVAMRRHGQGIDLHRECSRVIHHDGHWNPAVVEQQTGRVDRIHSRTARLRELGRPCDLHVGHPFLAGTVDEQILLRSFERASWYDALLGGKDDRPSKEVDGDDDEPEAVTAERRFPSVLARELAIDLSPPPLDAPEGGHGRDVPASSTWPSEGGPRCGPARAHVERLLRALASQGYLLSDEADGALVLEGMLGVRTVVRVRAALSETDLELSGAGSGTITRSLESLLTDADVYELFTGYFMSGATVTTSLSPLGVGVEALATVPADGMRFATSENGPPG